MLKALFSLFFLLLSAPSAQAQNLMLNGACPGPIENRVGGMTANSAVRIIEGTAAGSAVVLAGPCAGTVTGLDAINTVANGLSNMAGRFRATTPTPPYRCGNVRQALDLTTCALTPVRSTPLLVDADSDGTPIPWDCDDSDASSTVVADDADCDGLITADDCDDSDPLLNGDDVDGDGVSTCDGDPDDADPSITSDVCPAGYTLAFDIEDDFSDQIPNDCAWLWDTLFSQSTHISLEWFGTDGSHFGPATWDLSLDYGAIESAYSGCSGSNYDLPDETGTYWMTLVQYNDLLHISAAGDPAADGTDYYYGRIGATYTEADEVYAVGFSDWTDAWNNNNEEGDRFIGCYAQ